MIIKKINVNDILPYEINNKVHPAEQIEFVAGLIREYGFTQPLVVSCTNELIIGHCRLESAKILNMKVVPCVVLDDLSDAEIRALRIQDNRSSEMGAWDLDNLKIEIGDLDALDFNVDALGFDTDFLENELGLMGDGDADEDIEAEDALPDEAPELVKVGDIIELGIHKIMCGDATNKDDVARLLDGQKVDMVFTDPPYGINFVPRKGPHHRTKIKGDNGDPSIFYKSIPKAREVYIWGLAKNYLHLQSDPKSVIIWRKEKLGLGRGYRNQYEICFYWGSISRTKRCDSNVWDLQRDVNTSHPAQKPVGLCERAIENSRPTNILDLFLGSGSTLIAGEKNQVPVLGMEIEASYCDIIIKRYCEFTGATQIKINGKDVDV